MNIQIHAGNGKKFVLTDKGKEVGRIAAKYANDTAHYYDHCVPELWVKNGWVEEAEVKI